jgi:sugar-specific transcriptional regulator TrmB
MDHAILKELGLTEGEIKVYTALLSIGPSTTGPIVEQSGISRSIIYFILDKLMEKGLVSYIIKDKTKYFQAAEPYRIKEYADEKEKAFVKTKAELDTLIPALTALRQSAQLGIAQIYEGLKGIQTVHEHTYEKLKKGEEYFYLGIPPFQQEAYHLYWQRDHVRRTKAGIKCRLLFNLGTDKRILVNRNKYKGCEARYMPLDIQTPAWIMGYKDTVVIGLPSEKGLAIEIVNQSIADSFKAYFENFWSKSHKFG